MEVLTIPSKGASAMPTFPSAQERPYLSANELADLCDCDPKAVTRRIVWGELPARRDRNRWRIEYADALRFFTRMQTNEATSASYWREFREWRREAAVKVRAS
jgi:hypothetical protein